MSSDELWPRRRLYWPQLENGSHQIVGDAARHAIDVLRLRSQDRVTLFDGQGRQARATILAVQRTPAAFTAEVGEAVEVSGGPELCVALASPKGARVDWVVEKLTEVGVARIAFLECARGVAVVKPARLQRLRRLAIAAAAQCGRADIPTIEEPMAFADFVAAPGSTQRLLADRDGLPAARCLGHVSADAELLIGPEGGFTRDELETAKERRYNSIHLGRWILRVETAAVIGAALVLGAFADRDAQ